MIRETVHRSFLAVFAGVLAGAPAGAQTTSPVTVGISREASSMGGLSEAQRQQLQQQQPLSRPLGQAPNPAPAAPGTLPRVFAPTLPRVVYTKYPWKTEIMTTVFWIGELPTENNPTPNTKSSWDTGWVQSFGGFDNPDPTQRAADFRSLDFRPASFVPKQNPFYVALPYNDLLDYKTTKPEASRVIPWFKQTFERHGKSICRDRWIAIRYGDRICYAQWSDCGPFLTDDVNYVFGDARPANDKNNGAGLDVSPAVRDYLGFRTNSKVDWRFVDVNEVPEGPWRKYGDNNHFVQQAGKEKAMVASRLEELRRQRDEWFRKNGAREMQLR